MAQNYIRQSTLYDGETITASLFNNEYNQIVNAFSYSSTDANSTGHTHDGSLGQGGNIPKIGDLDFKNKIVVDSTNNRWGVYVEVSGAAVEQVRIQDGAVVPVTTNDIDLGTSVLEFKDLFLDGTAHVDTLDVDVNASVAGTLTVGGDLTVTGNATISGNLTFGDADTDSINLAAEIDSNIIPNTDGTYNLGSATKEWQDLYIDGTANIDSLVADTADINGGTIDGTVIGGTTAAAGSFTSVSLPDNGKAIFGAGSDLEIYHNATNNIIDSSTATLAIQAPQFVVQDDAGTKNLIWVTQPASSVFDVRLSYDGSTKLATTSTGIDITGDATFPDNGKAIFGAGSDLQIYHDGTHSYVADAGTGSLFLRSGSNIYVQNAGGTANYFKGTDGGAAELFHNGSSVLATTSTGIDVTGVITTDGMTTSADINFGDNDKAIFGSDSDFKVYHSGATGLIENYTGSLFITNASDDFDVVIQSDNGAGSLTDYFRADGSAGSALLYHYGSQKLATTATGIDVTGTALSHEVEIGDGSAGGTSEILFSDNVSARGKIVYDHSSNPETLLLQTTGSTGISIDNSQNVSIPNGDLDVTGSVTADGLTVSNTDGSIVKLESTGTGLGAGAVIGDLQFYGNDASTPGAGIKASITATTVAALGDDSQLMFSTSNGTTNNVNRMLIANNGDISFYEDTGTTAKLFWDASAESLGIGTTSPSNSLHIQDSALNKMLITNDDYVNGSAGTSFDVSFGATSGNTYSEIRHLINGRSAWGDFVLARGGGNVGIGTSSPSRDLSLNSSGTTTLQITNDTVGTSTTDGFQIKHYTSGATQLWGYEASYMSFATNNTEAMRIDSSGNLLVGVTSTTLTGGSLTLPNSGIIAFHDAAGNARNVLQFVSGDIKHGAAGSGVTTQSFYTSNTLAATIDSSGKVGISTSIPGQKLEIKESSTGAGDAIIRLRGDGNNANNTPLGSLEWFNTDSSGPQPGVVAAVEAQSANSNGHMGKLLFKTHDGSGSEADPPTTRMTIDQSGNVGIGTTSPSRALEVYGAVAGVIAITSNSTDGISSLSFGDTADDNAGRVNYLNASDAMLFYTATAERVRIDALGNASFNTTNISPSANNVYGTAILQYGGASMSRVNSTTLDLNRSTSDGTIVNLRKDGTIVGSIGTNSGYVRIGTDDTNLLMHSVIDAIVPHSGSANRDAAIDLGYSGARFKDLYLSGNAIFADNGKAIFGAGSDLQIYHDGSHSYIKDTATGNLRIDGTDIQIRSDAGANMAAFVAGAEVQLYHNNQKKFETTATGVDISGNLEVAGNNNAGSKANFIRITDTDTTASAANPQGGIEFYTSDTGNENVTASIVNLYAGTGGGSELTFNTASSGSAGVSERLRINDFGNVGIGINPAHKLSIFGTGAGNATVQIEGEGGADPYINFLANNTQHWSLGIDDSDADKFKLSEHSALGTNDYFVVDVTGNVGIGTDSPVTNLDVRNNISMGDGTSVTNLSMTRNSANYISASDAAGYLVFRTGSSVERVRIDSSGNALFGKTVANNTDAGTTIYNDNGISVVRDSNTTAIFNRLTNDGEIITIRKDGATIGSIGTVNGDMYLGTGDTGLFFSDGSNYIMPYNVSTPGLADGLLDLGRDTNRFKDLHLSGTATIGGLTVDGATTIAGSSTGEYDALILRNGNSAASGQSTAIVFEASAGTSGDEASSVAKISGLRTGSGSTGDLLFHTTLAGVSSEAMRIDSSGKVGIGTDSPTGLLHLSSSAPAFYMTDTTNNTEGVISMDNAGSLIFNADLNNEAGSSNIRFAVDGSEAMRIDASGNLLVGRTSTTTSNLGVTIPSGGSIQATSNFNALGLNRLSGDGDIAIFQKSGATIGSIGVDSSDNMYITSSATNHVGLYLGGGGVLPMNSGSLDSGDNVDIGSPNYQFADLHLSNSVALRNDTSVTVPAINFTDTDTSPGVAQTTGEINWTDSHSSYGNTGVKMYGQYTASGMHSFVLRTNDATTPANLETRLVVNNNGFQIYDGAGSEAARFDGSGNLLVGRTSAFTFSTNTADGVVLSSSRIDVSAASVCRISQLRDDTGTYDRFYNDANIVGSITGTTSATAYNTSSDQRLKDNIVDAPSASDDIDAIQVRSFDWKVNGSHQKYGMVAQELQTVAPEAVSAPEDPEEMMGVDYSKLVPMMLKEIQSLRARVAQLEL